MSAEERWAAYQFLLPTAAEIIGIASDGWVEPESLKAKTTILRRLGWDKNPPSAPLCSPVPEEQPNE